MVQDLDIVVMVVIKVEVEHLVVLNLLEEVKAVVVMVVMVVTTLQVETWHNMEHQQRLRLILEVQAN
jgi:hypothetical protein